MKIVPASTFVPLGGRQQQPILPANSGNPADRPFSALSAMESPAAEPLPRSHSTPGSVPAPAAAASAAGTHQPATLHVERDGDRITHIEVRCGCGEVHRIACTY